MCALILIFALAMSLVINLIERMIIDHNKAAKKPEPEEALVPKKPE